MLQCNCYAETLNGRSFRLVLGCDAGYRSRRIQFRDRMKRTTIDLRGGRRDFGLTADRNIVDRNRSGIVNTVLRTGRQACHRNKQNENRQPREELARFTSQL
jgi:hypothetical protein